MKCSRICLLLICLLNGCTALHMVLEQRLTHKNPFRRDCIEREVRSTNVYPRIELHTRMAVCACVCVFNLVYCVPNSNVCALRTQGDGRH